jgi:hypothetical protein
MKRTLRVFSLFVSHCSLAISISLVVLTAPALAGSNEQVIYRFQGGSDGYNPASALLSTRPAIFTVQRSKEERPGPALQANMVAGRSSN